MNKHKEHKEKKEKKKAVILLSGGLDSLTCLALAQSQGYETYPISFDYGQKHRAELDAAQNISKIYKVESMRERKAKMEELSDAFIALPGGYGTFEEIIDVIASSQIGYHKKPCAFVNINGYYDKLIEFFYSCSNSGFMDRRFVDMLIVSDNIDEIIEKIKNYEAPKAKWDK